MASEAQHAELVERINQLNILRESNATLRADCENYSKRSRDLEAKLKALSTELEPVKEQARVSQAELQARDVQVKRLEAESKRWQDRNAQLLSKASARFFIICAALIFSSSMIALTQQRSNLSKTKLKNCKRRRPPCQMHPKAMKKRRRSSLTEFVLFIDK